jgi:hypothetical protein
MAEQLPIVYREFYDVPRLFVVNFAGRSWLIDGGFDDAADEYPDAYAVYAMPALSAEALAGDWSSLADRATRPVGKVPTGRVTLDATRRKTISSDVLEGLIGLGGGDASRGVA